MVMAVLPGIGAHPGKSGTNNLARGPVGDNCAGETMAHRRAQTLGAQERPPGTPVTGVAGGLEIFGWHRSAGRIPPEKTAGRKRQLTYATGIYFVVVVFHIVRVLIHIR
jgi:hypothetical protein